MKKLLTALALSVATAAPVFADEIPTLRVGWMIPAEEAKYLMLKRPELFPDLGKKYKIEWSQFKGTSPMMQALRAGALDCSTMAPLSMAQAYLESGLESYIVAQHAHEEKGYFSPYWAVKKDSPIKTAQDLKGKIVGTNAYGSGMYYQMILWLKQNGLDHEKDVKIVETGFPPSADAIRTGRVDTGPLVQPFALLAEEKGDLRPLFMLSEVQSPTVYSFEGCSKAYADKNPEVVRLYVKDLQRAMTMLLEDRKLAVEVTAEVTRAPAEMLDKYLFTEKDFTHIATMKPDIDAIQQLLTLQSDAGFLAKPVDVSEFVREDIMAPLN
jgi:ABC-type nitrate/sulfonate/bicarbonate transport system substrate-binding protein